jgi:ABC-type nitrate/sulfonate/bicarbonate transport system substrate-binding protein
MSEKITINVMGVPEHFNLPWYLAIEAGQFAEAGIDLRWQDAPGGTGAMMRALASGEADLVVALTEGVVAGIIKGTEARIVQQFVSSPLRWGIHVAANGPYRQVEALADSRFAISRPASGSHLMAFVLGQQQGWDTRAMRFVEVGGMAGAREALSVGTADTFMWEQLMTKPIVDRGEFRRLGAIDTPWPCFVIAARQQLIEQHPEPLGRLLQIIRREAPAFGQRDDAVAKISERFELSEGDVREWLSRTEWAADNHLGTEVLKQVTATLLQIEAIAQEVDPGQLCDQHFVSLRQADA